jgi:hypothetical protein
MLFGGAVLFLLAQGWYLWVVPRAVPRLHLAGAAALGAAGCAALVTPAYGALLLSTGTLVALALLGSR